MLLFLKNIPIKEKQLKLKRIKINNYFLRAYKQTGSANNVIMEDII